MTRQDGGKKKHKNDKTKREGKLQLPREKILLN